MAIHLEKIKSEINLTPNTNLSLKMDQWSKGNQAWEAGEGYLCLLIAVPLLCLQCREIPGNDAHQLGLSGEGQMEQAGEGCPQEVEQRPVSGWVRGR